MSIDLSICVCVYMHVYACINDVCIITSSRPLSLSLTHTHTHNTHILGSREVHANQDLESKATSLRQRSGLVKKCTSLMNICTLLNLEGLYVIGIIVCYSFVVEIMDMKKRA